MNNKLAVIIPYAQEGANTFFTCRAIHEDLLGTNHEIIVVDNMCEELKIQLSKKNQLPDRGHDHIDKNNKFVESHLKMISKQCKWLKYLAYDKVLSHWQCKNYAIENTDADFLMFIDSHCIPSQGALKGIFEFYKEFSQTNKTTIHLPLTYNILDDKRLIYSLRPQLEDGFIGYSFCSSSKKEDYYEVPCMSTCGCLITRDLYNQLFGAWKNLRIYGGGENILNFVLSIQGVKHHIYNKGTLFHHGEARGYHYTWDTFQYNRATAMYLIDGEKLMDKFLSKLKGDQKIIDNMRLSVLNDNKSIREKIIFNQIMTIEEYVNQWNSV